MSRFSGNTGNPLSAVNIPLRSLRHPPSMTVRLFPVNFPGKYGVFHTLFII